MPFENWLKEHTTVDKPLIPASTVIPIRKSGTGIEILMMRRNSKLSFAEGMWVFPGGKVDEADWVGSDNDHATAVTAAVRECEEESGLVLDPENLTYYSHWLPPVEAPKRFSTWFFLTETPEGKVTIDNGEITDHAWFTPNEALIAAHAKKIEILPPTWITLFDLSQFLEVNTAIESVRSRGPRAYATKIVPTTEGLAAVWEGDSEYSGESELQNPHHHRLVMTDNVWKFQLGIVSD